jgi:hypothetical protein
MHSISTVRRSTVACFVVSLGAATGPSAQAQGGPPPGSDGVDPVFSVRWVRPSEAKPDQLVRGGYESSHMLPICHGPYKGGTHPGKVVANRCNIGYGGKEVTLTDYEVLAGGAYWAGPNPGLAGAFVGGQEQGRSLYVCLAKHNDGVHPGKVVAGKCNFGYGGKELTENKFDVLYIRQSSDWQVGRMVHPTDNQSGHVKFKISVPMFEINVPATGPITGHGGTIQVDRNNPGAFCSKVTAVRAWFNGPTMSHLESARIERSGGLCSLNNTVQVPFPMLNVPQQKSQVEQELMNRCRAHNTKGQGVTLTTTHPLFPILNLSLEGAMEEVVENLAAQAKVTCAPCPAIGLKSTVLNLRADQMTTVKLADLVNAPVSAVSMNAPPGGLVPTANNTILQGRPAKGTYRVTISATGSCQSGATGGSWPMTVEVK